MGHETNEKDVRKRFYGIIRELDKRLLFVDLLKQLLKIVKDQNNSSLMRFNIIFITECLNDPQMNATDFNQVIDLVYQALKHYQIKKAQIDLKKLFNQKKLNDYLIEFEEDFNEKISKPISNEEPVSIDLPSNKLNIQESDIRIYFPISIENKKILKFQIKKKI